MQAWLLRALPLLVVLLALAGPMLGLAGAKAGGVVVVAHVTGVVDSATADYVVSAIREAERAGGVLVLVLDTPGGSLDAALEITEALKSSRVPVIGYVKGSWAVSAGTLILECCHVAAMAPGTVIGAMQPVAYNPASGGFTPVKESKVLNPIYKSVEACMRLHNRNTSLARSFVYENLVLDASEALEKGAIDLVASSLDELLRKVDGRTVVVHGVSVELDTWPARIVDYPMPLRLKVAHALADPLITSLLASLASLIILASILSGHLQLAVVGVALLLVALLGMGYSVNIVALAMLVVGIILLLVEILVIPGFGVVGATGIALIALGILLLPYPHPVSISPEYLSRVLVIVVAATAPLAVLVGIIVYKVMQTWKRKPFYTPEVVGKTGYVVETVSEDKVGFIRVEGELWQARSKRGKLEPGAKVRVVGKEDTVLIVEPYEEPK